MVSLLFLFLGSFCYAGTPFGADVDRETANVHWVRPTEAEAAAITETSYVMLVAPSASYNLVFLVAGIGLLSVFFAYLKYFRNKEDEEYV